MAQLPQWVAQYIGLAFTSLGRTRESGVDCWGLVRLVYREQFAIELPSGEGTYENTRENEKLSEIIERDNEIFDPVTAPLTFDLVLLRLMGFPCHVGIIAAPAMMLHCRSGAGTAVERIDGIKYERRITGYFRHHDFGDGGFGRE